LDRLLNFCLKKRQKPLGQILSSDRGALVFMAATRVLENY
jgi:hypothetical protein